MHSKTDSRPGDSPAAGRPGISSASDTFNLIAAGAYDAELRLIAEQAQMLTLSNGAAIALRQGEFMVCRARSGATAPVLGARLDTQSGLSGECVRSARALVCDDTENDPRVNLDVCHYLGIRSIAVLPISLGHEVVGVFEAFSAQPRAFSGNEVAALESMRDLVISVIRPSPQAQTPAASALSARAAEDQPTPPSRLAETTPPPPRPPEKPPLAPSSPAITFDPEDDLLCELEQRAHPQPPSDPRTRAFQLLEAENPSPAPPRRPAPFLNPDPEDDLICEIEMHSAPRPLSEPYHAPALDGFAPAPLNLREPVISRKLIAFAVVVVLSGVIWLRWCNHAPRAAKNAAPSATVEAASAAVPGPAAPPVAASKPEATPPVAPASNPAQAAESAPALDAGNPAAQPPAPLPPPAQVRREHPARISQPRAAAPTKSLRASLESVAPMSSAPASAAPVNSSSLPAPAPPAPVATQHPAVPPVSAPVSPPAFTLRPSPPAASPSPPPGQLSLSQAVVSNAAESSSAGTLSPDALRLLLDSATAGDAGAQLALAVRYTNGEGVRQSYAEALKWFNQARAQGVTLSPGRVAEAWSKVQRWAQSNPEKR